MRAETNLPPPPLFTLRGHKDGITALANCQIDDVNYLVSGDEAGNVIIWDLSIYRIVNRLDGLYNSRIQSLRIVSLPLDGSNRDILIVQTRDEGVQLLDLKKCISKDGDHSKCVAAFPTWPSIFSRGDAITVEPDRGILAYPSCLENFLVTVRILSTACETILSGTAQRQEKSERGRTVFDIVVKHFKSEYLILVAYEDGVVGLFKFSSNSLLTLPHLQATGLKIDLIKTYDLEIGDFISAVDFFITTKSDKLVAYCGSPLAELKIIVDSIENSSRNNLIEQIPLKRRGVSALKIRPDLKLFVIGCWDSTVKLYSIKSNKPLATLKYHSKQVGDIHFVKTNSETSGDNRYLLCCGSSDGTISISNIY